MSIFKCKAEPPTAISCFYRWLEFSRRHQLMTLSESNKLFAKYSPGLLYLALSGDKR